MKRKSVVKSETALSPEAAHIERMKDLWGDGFEGNVNAILDFIREDIFQSQEERAAFFNLVGIDDVKLGNDPVMMDFLLRVVRKSYVMRNRMAYSPRR